MEKTIYEVQYMKNFGIWKKVYSTEDENLARNFAGGLATNNPQKSFRMLELKFKDGRLTEIKEYGVNPPHWCGEPKLPPRGPEIYLRGNLVL